MVKLASLAQNIQDFFLRDYAQESEFFQPYHYKFLATSLYHFLLNEQYKAAYRKSTMEKGVSSADLNGEWFQEEKATIKEGQIVTLCSPILSFEFDKNFCTLGDITPVKSSCQEYQRIAVKKLWELKHMPSTGISWFWLKRKDEIQFSKAKIGDEILVSYIPMLDPTSDKDQYIPENLEKVIFEMAQQWMKGIMSSGVIDTTNNANPNKIIESEIDTSFNTKR